MTSYAPINVDAADFEITAVSAVTVSIRALLAAPVALAADAQHTASEIQVSLHAIDFVFFF